MKLLVPCVKCSDEPASYYVAELLNDQSFEVTCSHDHSTRCVLQVPRYELFFESGALALVDGYPREAVTSFAVCVERFYEFWLAATLADKGVEEPAWRATWKQIAKQSERQLGAFVTTYQAEVRKIAPLMPEESVKFRNDVVHKGHWPNRGEAQRYAEAVLAYVCPLARELRQRSRKGVSECLRRQGSLGAKGGSRIVAIQVGTVVGRATAIRKATFNMTKDLELLRRRRFGLMRGSHES